MGRPAMLTSIGVVYACPVRAIFFDADGVLYVHGDRQAHLRAFLAHRGLALPPWPQLRAVIATPVQQAITGMISRDALYEAVLAACGLSPQPDLLAQGRAEMAADDSNSTLCDDVPETLRSLKMQGLRLGVITNSASGAEEKLTWLRTQGVDLRWDCFISSCEVGARKPDPEIYRLALARCGMAAHEAAFVGHSASELQGARQAGLTSIAIDPDVDAEADVTLGRFADLLQVAHRRRDHRKPSHPL